MAYTETGIHLGNEIHNIFWDCEIQIHRLIPTRRVLISKEEKKKKEKEKKKKKKRKKEKKKRRRTSQKVDFDVPADRRLKIKENENRDKYKDLAWELKKKNMELKEQLEKNTSGNRENDSKPN